MSEIDPALATLRQVPYLADLDPVTLAEIVAGSERRRFAPGERLVVELEPGADVFVVLSGEAEISVAGEDASPRVLGKVGPGDAFGEMSSLTGELRSATVTALGDVEALIVPDALFDHLRERRPQVALHLVRLLAARLASSERSVEALLTSRESHAQAPHGHEPARRGSLLRVWRELVVNREKDLAFLTLIAFVLTLVAIRGAVFLSFHYEIAPRALLRSAYLTGFTLVIVSACTSLLTFRPGLRRLVALAYGVGLALILNELGVTLAFDIFFKDIHTPDPNVPFDIERLYRRTEPVRFILLGLLLLVQIVYLRRFYRRAAFVVGTRVRRMLSRGPGP
jgi:CRP-like cAMP-binding protein